MTKASAEGKPRVWLRRIKRALLAAVGLACVAGLVAHFTWKYSGSGAWQLEIDKRGIQVYSMKVPGRTVKRFKAVTRIKSTLSRIVAAQISTKTEDCAEWSPSCRSIQSIEPWDDDRMTYVHLYQLDYPRPFKPREYLLKAEVSQDAATKAVLVEFTAMPDALPRNACCVRIEQMHNRWLFTPRGDGEIEVQLETDMDPQMPYFMVNSVSPGFFYQLFRLVGRWYGLDKWANRRFPRIQD
jgi:hypothetical protein